MVNKKNVSKMLLDYRLRNNITQARLAKLAGISRATLVGLEKGKTEPNTMTLYKLNRVLRDFENFVNQE